MKTPDETTVNNAATKALQSLTHRFLFFNDRWPQGREMADLTRMLLNRLQEDLVRFEANLDRTVKSSETGVAFCRKTKGKE